MRVIFIFWTSKKYLAAWIKNNQPKMNGIIDHIKIET